MTDNSPFNCPAISVVVPMYNVEKYIGECLDSLLAQTFTNFEVVIVDDCSTDNSCSIVESYREKFSGRLRLVHTLKNSGYASIPRNKGIEFSCGEYLYFMDSDDTITPTALQELYTYAKNFDADVVHCEKLYIVLEKFWNNAAYRKQLKPYSYFTGEKILIKEPLVWQDNFEERIKFFYQRKLIWNVVVQLIRRDFLIMNDLRFCNIYAEDVLFTLCEICAAKKYVVVPSVIYYYRWREGSVVHSQTEVSKRLSRQLNALKDGVHYLDNFLSHNKFFLQRTNLKYLLFDIFVQDILKYLNEIYAQIPAPALDELVRKEFSDGDNLALMSFIFNALNVQILQLSAAQRRIAELEVALKSKS